MHGKPSETSVISLLLTLAVIHSPLPLLPPQRPVEPAAAPSTASVSSPVNVAAWRAGLDPSAPSLSPPAAASAPGAHPLPPLDASSLGLGLGPVMGTRVPTGAAAVSVSPPPPSS